jgi:hypothetical protein
MSDFFKYFFHFLSTDNSPDKAASDLQKITLGNHKATCITVISILEIGRIGEALGIGNVNE